MEALLFSLIGVIIVQGGALWYKIGRLEQKISDHCKTHNGPEE